MHNVSLKYLRKIHVKRTPESLQKIIITSVERNSWYNKNVNLLIMNTAECLHNHIYIVRPIGLRLHRNVYTNTFNLQESLTHIISCVITESKIYFIF